MASSDPRIALSRLHRQDVSLVLRLIEQNPQTHHHLDWEPLRRWLYDPQHISVLAWEENLLRGVIAFSPPQNGTTWMRLLSLPIRLRLVVADALWYAALELLKDQVESVHVLAIQPWIEAVMRGWNFTQTDEVINLLRNEQPIPQPMHNDVEIRKLHFGETNKVLAVDHAAFAPMWQMRDLELREAGRRACSYKLAAYHGKVIGYQLTMHYANSLHLARLATHPDYQGNGVGQQLVCEMLQYAERHRIPVVTVNTQRSNQTSQRLYDRLGFVSNGNDLPVYSFSFGAETPPQRG